VGLIADDHLAHRQLFGQLGSYFIGDNHDLCVDELARLNCSLFDYQYLLYTYTPLQPFTHLVLPNIFERAWTDHQNRKRFWVKETACQRLDRLTNSHLISNQYSPVVLQTKCQSFPLEGVQLAIKWVILQNVLFAGQNLLIDVQRLIVCSDHLQKVRWRFEVI